MRESSHPRQSNNMLETTPRTHSTRACFGLLMRQERWGFSGRGRLILVILFVAGFIAAVLRVHPFLAVTQRTDTDILVVEGWINQFTTRTAAKEFNTGSYHRLFTTGGPVKGSGGYINDQETVASVTAGFLRQAGVRTDAVQMVPSHVIGRDRTYSSAVALRDWFRDHNMSVRNFNVLTEDAHARRTRMLFQEAFGKDVKVGIISVPSPDYDAAHWWRYSEGVREVLDETIAYIYAKFFFWPETPH